MKQEVFVGNDKTAGSLEELECLEASLLADVQK